MLYQMIEDDIVKARKCTDDCAVVRCFKRVNGLDLYEPVSCGTHFLTYGKDKYRLPRHVRCFIAEFDSDCDVQPISFELERYS